MRTRSKPIRHSLSHPHEPAPCSEAGYLLVGVVVMVALVLIALAVAAPVIAKDVRRDKEVESEHRAQQYVRAIRLYYRKLNSYPPSIDALKKTNNIRFLRQEYVDPLTGKADWRLLHLGEQKTTVKVFFGQELGALGASGGMGSGLGSAAGMGSGRGTPIGGAGMGGAGMGGAGGMSPLGASLAPTLGGSSSTGATGGTGSTGSTGGLGSASSLASTGASGSTGGGAIIGVGPAKTGNSILTPNKQTAYEKWEFWYDPRIEQLYQKGRMNAGVSTGTLNSQPASSFGSSSGAGGSTGAPTPFGGSNSPFGGSSPFGGTSAPTGSTGPVGNPPSSPGSSTAPQ